MFDKCLEYAYDSEQIVACNFAPLSFNCLRNIFACGSIKEKCSLILSFPLVWSKNPNFIEKYAEIEPLTNF